MAKSDSSKQSQDILGYPETERTKKLGHFRKIAILTKNTLGVKKVAAKD